MSKSDLLDGLVSASNNIYWQSANVPWSNWMGLQIVELGANDQACATIVGDRECVKRSWICGEISCFGAIDVVVGVVRDADSVCAFLFV